MEVHAYDLKNKLATPMQYDNIYLLLQRSYIGTLRLSSGGYSMSIGHVPSMWICIRILEECLLSLLGGGKGFEIKFPEDDRVIKGETESDRVNISLSGSAFDTEKISMPLSGLNVIYRCLRDNVSPDISEFPQGLPGESHWLLDHIWRLSDAQNSRDNT